MKKQLYSAAKGLFMLIAWSALMFALGVAFKLGAKMFMLGYSIAQ
jgi:cytoskeletal protein RodZ